MFAVSHSAPPRPTRATQPGTALTLMVLSDSPEGCAAVDLASGALVRAVYPAAASVLGPFEVVGVTLAEDEDDPIRPEAVTLTGAPIPVGRMRPRAARRRLGAVTLPEREQPLGFAASVVRYCDVRGDRPSLAVLTPQRGPVVLRGPGDTPLCRFRWRGVDLDLPLADGRAAHLLGTEASGDGPDRLGGEGLTRRLGFRPAHLVVALSGPHQGRCHKVVAGLVPEP